MQITESLLLQGAVAQYGTDPRARKAFAAAVNTYNGVPNPDQFDETKYWLVSGHYLYLSRVIWHYIGSWLYVLVSYNCLLYE